MKWFEEHSGLWGFLALIVTVIALLAPLLGALWRDIRDRGKPSDQLHRTLRRSKGRVAAMTLQSTLIGTRTILPMHVESAGGTVVDAVADVYERVKLGRSSLIVGVAGAGKSQLLASLHTLSYDVATGPSDPLIEVVALAALQKRIARGHGAHDQAAEEIARRYGMSRAAVLRLIKTAQLVVAFDGLDEVDGEGQVGVARGLAEAARELPIIVTMRRQNTARLASDSVEAVASPLAVVLASPSVQLLSVEQLQWSDVEQELKSVGVPTPSNPSLKVLHSFTNPLNVQILVFLWKAKRLDEERVARLFSQPSSLIENLLAGDRPPGGDRSLLLAALLSGDHSKQTDASFGLFPLQFAGWAIRVTKLLMIAVTIVVCALMQLWVMLPVLVVGIAMGSLFAGETLFDRLLMLGSSRWAPNRALIVYVLASFVIVHICRIASWSIQEGRWDFGQWSDFVDLYWVALASYLLVYLIVPPFDVAATPILSWVPALRGRAMPAVLLAIGMVLAAILWPIIGLAFLPFVIYLATVGAYLFFSITFGWIVTKTPPWQFHLLMRDLVSRGVLCSVGRRYKFTHAEVESVLLQVLADATDTPGTLWRTYGPQWPTRLLSDRGRPAFERRADAFELVVRRLAWRDSWNTTTVNNAACYYQWIRLDPDRGLALVKRHLRQLPRSDMRALLGDALDRVGDARGLTQAGRTLARADDVFVIHWSIGVAERHEARGALVALVEEMLSNSRSARVTAYLERRAMLYALWGLSDRGERARGDVSTAPALEGPDGYDKKMARVAIALEQPSPDIAEARANIALAARTPLWYARAAQDMSIEDEMPTARRFAGISVEGLEIDSGYLDMLEIMVTAAAIGRTPEAVAWVERAIATGLRIRYRTGLMRNLGLEGDPLGAIFEVERTE